MYKRSMLFNWSPFEGFYPLFLHALCLLVLFFSVSVLSGEPEQKQTPKDPRYQQVILEDFESEIPWKIRYRNNREEVPVILATVSDLDRRSSFAGKRYLYIDVQATPPLGFTLRPQKTYPTGGYIREVSLWVEGSGGGEKIKLDVLTHEGRLMRYPLCIATFHGWKECHWYAPASLIQRIDAPNGGPGVGIAGIYVEPGKNGRLRLSLDGLSISRRPFFLLPTEP